MGVHLITWIALAAIVIVLLVIDFVGHVRTPHAPSLKEAAIWSAAYICLAVTFGLFIGFFYGWTWGAQYFNGWIIEYSLSLDNLFVFVIILAAFRVPREFQQKVLLIGISFALVLRFVFILLGAALLERFSWIFYIFGAFLVFTAIKQALQGIETGETGEEEYKENAFTRLMRKALPVTDGFKGDRLLFRHRKKTYITPMFLVIMAVGSADVLFAVDSIPAIFAVTQEPFLVFATNAFALLGLRQLFFLIGGLIQNLVFLHYGLAAILGFIGVKQVIHALHENTVSFINGGQPVLAIPEPGNLASFIFLLVTLTLTAIASIIYNRVKKPKPPQENATAN